MDGALHSSRRPHDNRAPKRGRVGGGGGGGQGDPCLPIKHRLISLKPDTVLPQLAQLVHDVKRTADGEYALVNTVLACVESFPTQTNTFALLVGALAGLKDDDAAQSLALRVLVEAVRRIKSGSQRGERLVMRFLVAAHKACGLSLDAVMQAVLDPLLPGGEEGELTKTAELRLLAVVGTLPWLALSAAATRAEGEDAEGDVAKCQSWIGALATQRLPSMHRTSALRSQYAALPRAQSNRLDADSDRLALGVAMAACAGGGGEQLLLQHGEFDYALIAGAQSLPAFGELRRSAHMDLVADLAEELAQCRSRLLVVSSSGGEGEGGDAAPGGEQLAHLPLFRGGQEPVLDQAAAALEEVRRQPTLVERFLVRENVVDVLGSYFPKAGEAADALLALNAPYQAVEGCMSQMLAMPLPEHSALFYGEVMIHMCLKAPETVPAAIEDALDQVLEMEPENLDADAVDRLALWFANHVLAFDLDWPWVKWQNVLQLAETRSVRLLVECALQRIALVYPAAATQQALDEVEMPKELADRLLLLSRSSSGESAEATAASGLLATPPGQQMVQVLQARPSTGELVDFLTAQLPDTAEWSSTHQRVAVLVHAALFLGRGSLSQTRAALEHVAPALQNLASGEGSSSAVAESALEAVVDFWRPSSAWMEKWTVFAIGCLVDVGVVGDVSFALSWLASRDHALSPYFKRRAMEDVLARAGTREERENAIKLAATTRDVDENTDLWLARRALY